MTRLNYETDQVSVVTLMNEDLGAGDVIVIRTIGGVYDIEEDYLLIGNFANQPKEHVVSDNFPFATVELKGMWKIKSDAVIPLESVPEECLLHPHWSAAVKVRVGYNKESAESYRIAGVISDFEAGDVVSPRSLLTEEKSIC